MFTGDEPRGCLELALERGPLPERVQDVIPRALVNATVRRSQAPSPPKRLGLKDEMSPQGFWPGKQVAP